LSGSQTALAEFLRLDRDLIAVAAESSEAALPPGPDLETWVASLAAGERDALLIKLLRGDDPHVRAATLRRAAASAPGEGREGRRTVRELQSSAEISRDARQTAERIRREAAAIERERALAAARERRVSALRAEGEGVWRRIAALVASKKPAEYDQTVELLVDLRDACSEKEFSRRISELRDEHRRKPSSQAPTTRRPRMACRIVRPKVVLSDRPNGRFATPGLGYRDRSCEAERMRDGTQCDQVRCDST
jgi:hypothetical protein